SLVKIELESEADKLKIESEAEMEIYKVVQEALMNIIKHAKAENVEIHIGIIDEEFQVIIEDDGRGFDIENTRNGLGMSNMQSRIEKLKGKLIIDSKLGRGTSIIAEIPYKQLI
ncbi:MAG: ATP-binding protein, partial [Bacteroidetes bacterium]|nr:ATP-binding protein [Bacteroidota bacterium]